MFTHRLRIASTALLLSASAVAAQDLRVGPERNPERAEKFQPFVNVTIDCSKDDQGLQEQLATAINAAIAYAIAHNLPNIHNRHMEAAEIPPRAVGAFRRHGFLDFDVSSDDDKPRGPHIVCKPRETSFLKAAPSNG